MDNITTGFGYVRFGICNGCSRPRHLFAGSNWSSVPPMCQACWTSKMYFSSYDELRITDIINPTNFPIMADEGADLCQACGHPEYVNTDNQIWALREAHLSGANLTIVAHVACSQESACENCDIIYATSVARSRDVRRDVAVDLSLIEEYLKVDQSVLCTRCADEYMDAHGGKHEFFQCLACNEYAHDLDGVDWEGSTYCQRCYQDNVYECGNCGVERWSGDDHECNEDDQLIHSYSYRPSPYFFGSGKYHFGFELEVECRGTTSIHYGANMVSDSLGARVYLKEDGSLNDGFEIVTHPHTLEAYQKEFKWDILDALRKESFRSWNTTTCGLHVHVSRKAFGEGDPWEYPLADSERSTRILKRQAHELRFMKLIYDNQRQVERIAGRSNSSYATFQDKGNLVRKVKYGHQGNGRYSAINTENDSTIEIRVFRGSLRKERVLSAIEFVHACVEYTRDVKVTNHNHALSWLKFTGYVSNRLEQYPNLVKIMSESFAGDSDYDEN